MEAQIISSYSGGMNNADLDKTISRLKKQGAYKDLSTVIIIPAYGQVPTKAVAAWWNLMTPPNQKIVKLFAVGMEVGKAYSECIESILAHPDLCKFKYILTMEHDNIPPPDGLIKLLERMEENPQFSCIGGLYYTKGAGGVAQIWGNPNEHPLNFKPQLPDKDGGLVECSGTGMGFNVFRVEMFKDQRIARPLFETTCDAKNGMFTQDLKFWQEARKYGYTSAIDCSVKVGHYSLEEDFVW